MAVTIFHKVINNTRVRIVNKKPKEQKIKISGNIKAIKHEINEVKVYDT